MKRTVFRELTLPEFKPNVLDAADRVLSGQGSATDATCLAAAVREVQAMLATTARQIALLVQMKAVPLAVQETTDRRRRQTPPGSGTSAP